MNLFLKVIAYILGRNRIGRLGDRENHDGPQSDEYIRRTQKKRQQHCPAVVLGKASGRGMMSAPFVHANVDWITYVACGRIGSTKKKSNWFAVGGGIFSRTDLRTPRTAHHINLPEPACSENDPVLPIAQQVPSAIRRSG